MECSIEKRKCGCKGIRTCLICENEAGKLPTSINSHEDSLLYTYCPHCNLCWPKDELSQGGGEPLYLGNITLILNFLNQEEEMKTINAIDQISWMPSQSGRKKQDFGPKVNFKKKKGKVGDFRGFPRFTKNLIEKFQEYNALADFFPVELCHLDYSPDRGSAIEPHLDDVWIWGERLVTINLASSTILTLTPTNCQACVCFPLSKTHFVNFVQPVHNEINNYIHACSHKLLNLDSLRIESSTPDSIASHTKSDFLSETRSMCSAYRTEVKNRKVAIQIPLPARSLLVLAGCARHNWYHEIKRYDIKSRRLAMTFRELSSNFLTDETEKQLGDELLKIGRTFI